MKYSSSKLIDKNVRQSCNAGYLFLQDIYYSLGIDKICSAISDKYKFDYDLNDILSMLVYSRILAPGSKMSSLESSKEFLEQPKCELHQIYRALEVIAKENDFSRLSRGTILRTAKLQVKQLLPSIRNRLITKQNMMVYMPYVQILNATYQISLKSIRKDGNSSHFFANTPYGNSLF